MWSRMWERLAGKPKNTPVLSGCDDDNNFWISFSFTKQSEASLLKAAQAANLNFEISSFSRISAASKYNDDDQSTLQTIKITIPPDKLNSEKVGQFSTFLKNAFQIDLDELLQRLRNTNEPS